MAVFGAPGRPRQRRRARGPRRPRHPRRHAGVRRRRSGRPLRVHVGVASGQVVAQPHRQHEPPRVHGHRRHGQPRLAADRRRAAPARSWSREAVRRALGDRLDCVDAGRARGQGLRPSRCGRGACTACAAAFRPTARRSSAGGPSSASFRAVLATCREGGPGPGDLRARRGRHRQDAAGRGVPASRRGGGLRLPRGLSARFRRRQRAGRGPRARAQPARPDGRHGEATALGQRPSGRWPTVWWRRTTPCSSTTCSTCRSRRSCAPSTTPWTTPRATAGKRATVAGWSGGQAATRPRLLVVEDLHWADALTLAQLAALRRDRGGMPGAPGR